MFNKRISKSYKYYLSNWQPILHKTKKWTKYKYTNTNTDIISITMSKLQGIPHKTLYKAKISK